MRQRDNYRWGSALMLFSEILIIAFSVYWLYGQYIKEKNSLEKELLSIYKQSYNSVIDSLIIDYIIEPAMGDSISMARYQFSGNRENVGQDGSEADSLMSNRTVEIRLKTMDSVTANYGQDLNDTPVSSEDMLIRGVKAFVMFSSDSGMLHRNYLSRASKGQDSVIFVEDFREKLSEEKINLVPRWVTPGEINKDSLTDNGYIVIGDFSGTLPAAVFSGNTYFIIERIIPQILFALILVIITGMAFLLARKNITRQQRLNEIRNSFISNISHELKTPVSTVKIAIEALKKYDESQGSREITAEYLEMAGKE
ncbi:MAG: histidine kinase dimerization/phospho-acceptor domain-containing protein, partial [Bacteroidales bacterium]|nr:histidine kinase dimerization/phospho-acceptor domain-containing protein [Bacteroidales bacterium]